MPQIGGLQYPMVFSAELRPEDLGTEILIDIPPGFILLNAGLAKRAAFNGATPEVSITDNKTVPTVIIASNDLSSLDVPNVEADIAVRYTEYRSGGKIRILPTVAGGAPTTGYADVYIQGVVRGRQNERFGSQYDA